MPSTSTLVSQSVLVFLFDNLSIHEDELSPPERRRTKDHPGALSRRWLWVRTCAAICREDTWTFDAVNALPRVVSIERKYGVEDLKVWFKAKATLWRQNI